MASFNEAFKAARKKQGAGGIFTWQGKKYSTDLAEEKSSAPKTSVKPQAKPERKPKVDSTPPAQPKQPEAIKPLKTPTAAGPAAETKAAKAARLKKVADEAASVAVTKRAKADALKKEAGAKRGLATMGGVMGTQYRKLNESFTPDAVKKLRLKRDEDAVFKARLAEAAKEENKKRRGK